jgi:hypothetical protein
VKSLFLMIVLTFGAHADSAALEDAEFSQARTADKAVPAAEATSNDSLASLSAATTEVVRAIVEAAEEVRDAEGRVRFVGRGEQLNGDRLTEHLFRQAADAANKLPPEVAAKAYLLGLGIAIDDSSVLRDFPFVGSLCRQVESDEARMRRLAVLGKPTMRGRRDLAQHFTVSCALTVLVGPHAAETAGVLKEVSDARNGSGFSFVDLSADLAGVTFATHVGDAKLSLATLASSFQVEDFLPEGGDLREGIAWEAFRARYGTPQDERFGRQRAAICRRILALPGYQAR